MKTLRSGKHGARNGCWTIFLAGLLVLANPRGADAKGYSGGGGHSYSSSSSSHSSGFSSSRSSSSGGGKSFSSGGKSYSSGGNERSSYGSGKSYSSGASSSKPPVVNPGSKSSGMSYDTAGARANKEQASKRAYESYKASENSRSSPSSSGGGVPPVIPRTSSPGGPNYGGGYSGPYRQTTVYVNPDIYASRPVRIHTYFAPYYSRPVVMYHDPYSSFFWWWLLDQSLEDRAMWTYHHRWDMDDARYQALLNSDAQLQDRVRQLEQRQLPVDPNYAPANLDRDLMYNDQTVNRAYANRPTPAGQFAFWVLMVPTALGVAAFLVWIVFFKRWQTA